MKIDLGHGAYLEPDDRSGGLTKWHRRIVATAMIAQTRSGLWCDLECGHRIQAFGDMTHADGWVFCTQCRDAEEK